jgi:hypothetical protein
MPEIRFTPSYLTNMAIYNINPQHHDINWLYAIIDQFLASGMDDLDSWITLMDWIRVDDDVSKLEYVWQSSPWIFYKTVSKFALGSNYSRKIGVLMRIISVRYREKYPNYFWLIDAVNGGFDSNFKETMELIRRISEVYFLLGRNAPEEEFVYAIPDLVLTIDGTYYLSMRNAPIPAAILPKSTPVDDSKSAPEITPVDDSKDAPESVPENVLEITPVDDSKDAPEITPVDDSKSDSESDAESDAEDEHETTTETTFTHTVTKTKVTKMTMATVTIPSEILTPLSTLAKGITDYVAWRKMERELSSLEFDIQNDIGDRHINISLRNDLRMRMQENE